MKKGYIYFPDRPGHYKSYADLLASLANGQLKPVTSFRISHFLFSPTYVVIDGDGFPLLLALLSAFRSVQKKRTLYFSVRTEAFVAGGVYGRVKLYLAKLVKGIPNTELVSIHRGDAAIEREVPAIYIYDPQFWDLPHIPWRAAIPPEMNATSANARRQPTLLIAGTLNAKRCVDELEENIRSLARHFDIIVAGAITQGRFLDEILEIGNITVINRYISDDELSFLLQYADVIYTYYASDIRRPSGFFGRAIQLDKWVLVREGGFLATTYAKYEKMIPVPDLGIANVKAAAANTKSETLVPSLSGDFDDSERLAAILTGT